MIATDLELVDMDPKDPFDFSVERWNDQLVAGYSKTTARARAQGAHAGLQRLCRAEALSAKVGEAQ